MPILRILIVVVAIICNAFTAVNAQTVEIPSLINSTASCLGDVSFILTEGTLKFTNSPLVPLWPESTADTIVNVLKGHELAAKLIYDTLGKGNILAYFDVDPVLDRLRGLSTTYEIIGVIIVADFRSWEYSVKEPAEPRTMETIYEASYTGGGNCRLRVRRR
ncbi:hypothetical protein DFH27DRAFT_524396 [Peziza echinospora]|nr:hypothetical protein DFH27DRAFT_524396 [Peziza echinospora]